MFWVNFFGLFYEQNSGNCFADFWWIFDARQNYNVTFSLWVSEPSYPVLWVLCKSMNFDPDKQLLQVACDRIEPLTLGQGQHSTPTSQGTHCQTKLYCYIQCARLRAFRAWFFCGFLEPDKVIVLHSECAAQSLPILRMAACHQSHRISLQLQYLGQFFFGQCYEQNSANYVGRLFGWGNYLAGFFWSKTRL